MAGRRRHAAARAESFGFALADRLAAPSICLQKGKRGCRCRRRQRHFTPAAACLHARLRYDDDSAFSRAMRASIFTSADARAARRYR